jgi:uncharacterized protein (DUF1778 family)
MYGLEEALPSPRTSGLRFALARLDSRFRGNDGRSTCFSAPDFLQPTRATRQGQPDIEAAQAQDKTVSEFLLDSGLASAAETLADRRLFILDDARWEAFQAALDAPPRARARLARLMKTGQ